MSPLGAYDDLVMHTLGPLGSRVRKLQHLCSLRNSEGQYQHWGLARKYGELPASRAAAQLHRDIWLSLLRTPLPVLHAELHHDKAGLAAFAELQSCAARAIPPDTGGGSSRHFRAVILSLAALAQARATTGRDA